jgi:adenylate cyclase
MAREIERKFLVADPSVVHGREGERVVQGYLSSGTVTLRVRRRGNRGFLTIKGPSRGIVRDEFEYEIPVADADHLLESYCAPRRIVKTRYRIPHGCHEFEVDVFDGHLRGLIIAEVELEHENQAVALPPWIGAEVSTDGRYYNASLARAAEPPGSGSPETAGSQIFAMPGKNR